MGVIEHEPQQRQVITPEASRFLPSLAVTKQPTYGHRVPLTGACVLPPNAGQDQAATNFVDGYRFHGMVS